MCQVALLVACLVWAAAAMPEPPVPVGQSSPTPQYGERALQAGYPAANSANTGNGYGDDGDYEDANYEFKYDVEEQESSLKFGHQEARQGDVATGRYYVLLPDGRTQQVEYTADQDGFHPKITYEDPRDQGYGSGAPGEQGGYSSGGGAAGGQNGYSNGGSSGQSGHSGGRNGYSSGGGAAGGQSDYLGGNSGGYSGSSGPGANVGYSR